MPRVTAEVTETVLSKFALIELRRKLDNQSICKIKGVAYVIESIEYYSNDNSAKVIYLQIDTDNICKHNEGVYPSYTHVTCNKCGMIKTDSCWKEASNTWFYSLAHAQKAKDAK